jgi:hypothetical protein
MSAQLEHYIHWRKEMVVLLAVKAQQITNSQPRVLQPFHACNLPALDAPAYTASMAVF